MQSKKQIIWRVIKDFLEKPLKNVFFREQEIIFQERLRKVYTIIWPRRAWKTYFCFQTISKLIDSWIKKENILYFNIENDELDLINTNDLNLILNTYFEIINFNRKDKYFVFLDEIQEIKSWERFVRKILDQFDNIQIVITWSSSKLLSKEIATNLRWRSLVYEIFPLNFNEILEFNALNLDFLSTEEYIKYNKIKNNYLKHGSFPEVILNEYNDETKKILRDYLDLIFYKDVIERNNFKEIKKVKDFRKYLISFIWDFFSSSKIEEFLKINYRTIQNWLKAFVDAFLIFEVKKFDFSILEQQKSNSKIYLIDNWFYSLLFGNYKQDFWKLFENLVFLELRKFWFLENENIFYYKDKIFDIDFILFRNWKIIPIQVCYELNKQNYKRELEDLEKFVEKFKLEKWILIVFDNNIENKSDKVNIIWIEDMEILL